jgi:DNA-binding MarR family transcriptional regulator
MPKAKARPAPSHGTGEGDLAPPTAGALLRMTYQGIRERQFAALTGKGFDDLNQPLLNVFLYPPPNRIRPSELAERANMTKQAMNYLLGQLEGRGYIERRVERGSSRRLVFLTNRGWQVREIILAVVTEVEAEWRSVLGQQRFDKFMNTLRQLCSIRQSDIRGEDGLGVVRRSDRSDRTLPRRGRKPSKDS